MSDSFPKEIEVLSEEEVTSNPNSRVVGMPVALMPDPGVPSVQHNCVDCGQPTWISLGASQPLVEKGLVQVMCMTCYGPIPDSVQTTPAVIKEVADYYRQESEGEPIQ